MQDKRRRKERGRNRKGSRPRRPGLRPNPRRQALYVLVVLAAVFGGYAAGTTYKSRPKGESESIIVATGQAGPGTPWYRIQAPPPAMITVPNAPIFPDPPDEEPAEPLRPYEEALPAEIYVPPPKPQVAPKRRAGERSRDAAPAPATPPPASRSASGPAPATPMAATRPPSAALAPEDLPPWRRFAVAAADTGGRPMIAVVIDDMGIDRQRSDRVIALQGPLTVSFLTYAKDLKRQAAAAAAAGHEILLHLPMEPGNRNVDPGPNVLLRDIEPDELRRRLLWGLDRFTGYVGINNHMGSRFTADRAAMTILMRELKRRRLLFLDSRTTGNTVGAALTRRFGVPFVERNIFLDNVNKIDAVNGRLVETERLARRRGVAVAIGHPREATLRALAKWLPTLESRGLALVPLTAVLRRPGAAG